MTTVIALRHGETDWNADRRVQGWAPTPLNERGREQAKSAGRHLATTDDFDRVIASDLRRTRETAELVCEAGVEPDPTLDRAWRERDFGVYQGLAYETMFEEYPEFSAHRAGESALAETPERGESLLDLRERIVDAFERLVGDTVDETLLVVTHGGPLYALLSHVTERNYLDFITGESQDNCAVNELRADDSGFAVVRENDTSYRR